MKAEEQIKLVNTYGERKPPIPRSQIIENKKKYNRKKLKRIKKEDLE